MKGILKSNLRCWRRSELFKVRKGVLISAEWDDTLQWWNVSFLNGSEVIRTTTTEEPMV